LTTIKLVLIFLTLYNKDYHELIINNSNTAFINLSSMLILTFTDTLSTSKVVTVNIIINEQLYFS